MYNFNYFSPYVKPKSKKGYYLGLFAIIFVLALGILIALTIFMKMQIKDKENEVISLTAQINDPALAAEIKKGIEFREKIQVVNTDKTACELLASAVPYMNAITKDKLIEINKLLTEDAMVLNMSCAQDAIDMEMVSRYDYYTSVSQMMHNFRSSPLFDNLVVSNLQDPIPYGNPSSFEYVRYPLKLYQNGGGRR